MLRRASELRRGEAAPLLRATLELRRSVSKLCMSPRRCNALLRNRLDNSYRNLSWVSALHLADNPSRIVPALQPVTGDAAAFANDASRFPSPSYPWIFGLNVRRRLHAAKYSVSSVAATFLRSTGADPAVRTWSLCADFHIRLGDHW